MPKPKTSLLEDVVANLPTKGQSPWHTTIDPDLLQELDDIRKQFLAGEIPRATKTGIASALSKSLKARGVDIGQRGVEAWLAVKR